MTINCECCGRQVAWSLDRLADHFRRLERGEHVACACDDDCATCADPWCPARLSRLVALAYVAEVGESAGLTGRQIAEAGRHD